MRKHTEEEIAAHRRKKKRNDTAAKAEENDGVDKTPLFLDSSPEIGSENIVEIDAELNDDKQEITRLQAEMEKVRESNSFLSVQLNDAKKEICSLLGQLKDSKEENSAYLENARILLAELEQAKEKIKHLNYQLENSRFDIQKFKSSDQDVEFYTGFSNYSTLLICYNIIESSAMNISYGKHERVNFNNEKYYQVGRPRALSLSLSRVCPCFDAAAAWTI